MKKIFIAACVVMLAGCSQPVEQKKAAPVAPAPEVLSLDSDKARFSYAIGMDISRSLESLDVEIDSKALAEAIADRLAGKKNKLSKEYAERIKQEYLIDQAMKRAAAEKAAAEKAAAEKAAAEKAAAEKAAVERTAAEIPASEMPVTGAH